MSQRSWQCNASGAGNAGSVAFWRDGNGFCSTDTLLNAPKQKYAVRGNRSLRWLCLAFLLNLGKLVQNTVPIPCILLLVTFEVVEKCSWELFGCQRVPNKGIADDGFVKCTVRASAWFGKLWTARHCQNRSEGFARMAYFSQVREGEGVRHREIPSRVLFFVRRLFCRETSVPASKAQQHLPLATSLRG